MEAAAFTARTPRRGGAHNARVTPFPWRSRKNAKRFCETIAWGQKKETVSLRSDLPNSILFTGKVFLGAANDPWVFLYHVPPAALAAGGFLWLRGFSPAYSDLGVSPMHTLSSGEKPCLR